MDRIVSECFKNPVKLEIYMRIKLMKRATAQQLLKLGLQIPPATLYRNLNRMLEDGILKVVEENKVRGVRERVYAVAVEVGDEEINEEKAVQKSLFCESVYATEEEMKTAASEIEQIIRRLKKNDAAGGRKKQAVGFVVTPIPEK